MRYPYVESAADWPFLSIYSAADRPTGGRADVGDPRLTYADVLREITTMAGDPKDIVDACLYWIAYQVTCEMRLSGTGKAVDAIAEQWGCETDESFGRRLAERAASVMSGAALVGALRAVAHRLLKSPAWRSRAEVMALAFAEYQRCGLSSGFASLVADDAHAHFALAGSLPEGEVRFRIDAFGAVLLGAAHARALTEPWNPFTRYRLRAEMKEHSAAVAVVRAGDPEFGGKLETVVQELDDRHAESNEAFTAYLERWGDDRDFEAYFSIRGREVSVAGADEVSDVARWFLDLQPKMGRVV